MSGRGLSGQEAPEEILGAIRAMMSEQAKAPAAEAPKGKDQKAYEAVYEDAPAAVSEAPAAVAAGPQHLWEVSFEDNKTKTSRVIRAPDMIEALAVFEKYRAKHTVSVWSAPAAITPYQVKALND